MINMLQMASIGDSYFMSCPEPPLCVYGVGSFPVDSIGFLIFLSVLLGVGSYF